MVERNVVNWILLLKINKSNQKFYFVGESLVHILTNNYAIIIYIILVTILDHGNAQRIWIVMGYYISWNILLLCGVESIIILLIDIN